MDTHFPFEGDLPDDGDEPVYEWLDEWLCEYVDGAMDPSLEAVFEKYVEANPELKAHVERLKKTRELLGNCGRPTESSEELESKICREVECEDLSPASVSEAVQNQPVTPFALVSSVAAALVIGFLVGAMVVGPVSSGSASAPPTTDRATVETDGPPPSFQRTQATVSDREPLLPRRSAAPFAVPDSGRSPSPVATTGTR